MNMPFHPGSLNRTTPAAAERVDHYRSHGHASSYALADDVPWTGDGTVRANEERRHDPARKAAIKAQIEERQAAFREARDLLRQAAEVLDGVGHVPQAEDALFVRNRDAVAYALRTLDRDAKIFLTEPNDTYLGNKAAFGAPPGWGE